MIPRYSWQVNIKEYEMAYEDAYHKIASINDFTSRNDLFKILKNVSNLFSGIVQEEVYCRMRSRQSNAHKRLVAEYTAAVKILNEHIVWGMLMV